MSEAVQYSLQRTRQNHRYVVGTVLYAFGMGLLSVSLGLNTPISQYLSALTGTVFVILGVVSWAVYRGADVDGWCRSVVTAIGGPYSYKPLNEWEEELEERGEFYGGENS